MEKIGKFYYIEKNVCTNACHCGWNITIGGENVGDLVKIEEYLKNISEKGEKDEMQTNP